MALRQSGILLASIVSRLCDERTDGVQQADQMLDALMDIVSLPGELSHRAFETIWQRAAHLGIS